MLCGKLGTAEDKKKFVQVGGWGCEVDHPRVAGSLGMFLCTEKWTSVL